MRLEFIDDCRKIYKRWSVQFSILAGSLLATMVSERQAVLDFINSLPDGFKPFIPLLTFVVSVGVPTLLLALKQPNLTKPPEE